MAKPFRYTGNGTVSSCEIDDCLVCNPAYKTLWCDVTKGPSLFCCVRACFLSSFGIKPSPTSDHNIKTAPVLISSKSQARAGCHSD